MDLETELEHLKKRLQELRTIEAHLSDVHLWFEKQEINLRSEIDYDDLSSAIDDVQNTIYSVEDAVEALQEEISFERLTDK